MPYRIAQWPWVPGWAKRVLTHVGRRGIILLFFGFFFVSAGLTWLETPPRDLQSFAIAFNIAPLGFWAWAQLVTGLVMFVGSAWKRIEQYAFALSAAVPSALCLGAIAVLIPGDEYQPGPIVGRIIFTYLFYTAFILTVSGWPEDPPVIVMKKNKDGDGA